MNLAKKNRMQEMSHSFSKERSAWYINNNSSFSFQLLKTLPCLQKQLDALLEFDVSTSITWNIDMKNIIVKMSGDLKNHLRCYDFVWTQILWPDFPLS